MRYMQEIINTINASSFRMMLVRLFGIETQVIDGDLLLTLVVFNGKRYVTTAERIRGEPWSI